MIRRMLTAAVLWTAASRVNAQTITGTIVDQTGRPIAGVLVQMLDSASNVTARALSSERGTFRVATPRAGTYRLKTLRIGFKPTTSDAVTLPAGGEVERRVVLTGALVNLDTMRVVDRRTCRITTDSAAAATFSVWDQARTALSATQLTTNGRSVTTTVVSYDRTLDAEGRVTLNLSSKTATQIAAHPWRTVSPDSLHRAGFVVTDRDGSLTYHAPSIDALLSPVFLDDHCFRLTTDRKRAGELGVAFEPNSDRKRVPEIKGTLWVDKATSELRQLEYRYVNISAEQENAAAGGDIEFARMLNGGWVISRWNVRMPVLEQTARTQAMGGTALHVAEIKLTGGELTLATQSSGRDTLWHQGSLVAEAARRDSLANALKIAEPVQTAKLATFTGIVVDSLEQPVSIAEVTMPDLTKTTASDTKGSFRIADVPAGDQKVVVRRVGYAPLETIVPFGAGATVDRKLVLKRARVLDSVVVTDARTARDMREFEENRRLGLGHFLTRDQLAKMESLKLAEVVGQFNGTRVMRGVGGRGWIYSSRNNNCQPGVIETACDNQHIYYPNSIEAAQGMGAHCYAVVYLDNTLLTPGRPTVPYDISSIPVEQIEAIEYYAGPATVPMRYVSRNTDCGVVVLHTRRKP